MISHGTAAWSRVHWAVMSWQISKKTKLPFASFGQSYWYHIRYNSDALVECHNAQNTYIFIPTPKSACTDASIAELMIVKAEVGTYCAGCPNSAIYEECGCACIIMRACIRWAGLNLGSGQSP